MFRLELNESRTKQTGIRELLKVLSKQVKDVPIIVIATKQDQFYSIKSTEARAKITRQGKDLETYVAESDKANEEGMDACSEQLRLIQKELLEIKGGRCDAAVSVSK